MIRAMIELRYDDEAAMRDYIAKSGYLTDGRGGPNR